MNFDIQCSSKCSFFGSYDCSMCSEKERFIRMHIAGGDEIPPMTKEQREFFAEDADHCGEGVYSSVDLLLLSDKDLAKCVMNAWALYVNSNCL